MPRFPSRWRAFEGIEGLPLIIVASNALVFLFDLVQPGLTAFLRLSHPALAAGEYWRLVTFLFVPPPMNPLFMVFWLYLVFLYANALERAWGSFRFTLYYLVGSLATAAVGFFPSPEPVPNAYLNASLFLAFTALFPDMELLLFFILPVKVKLLGYLTWVWLAWDFWAMGPTTRLAIAAAILSYLVLLGPALRERAMLRWQVFRNRRRWKN